MIPHVHCSIVNKILFNFIFFSQDNQLRHIVIACIDSVFLKQHIMGSTLCNSIFRENDDLISMFNRRQTVGNGDGRPVFGQFFQAALDPAFAFIIQGAGGLIKDQDRRIL